MNADQEQWQVRIENRGRGGMIYYFEGENSLDFEWDFGAGPAIAFIWPRNAENWDESYPWAKGRKKEILQRVAQDVSRQKARGCEIQYDDDLTTITLNDSKSLRMD